MLLPTTWLLSQIIRELLQMSFDAAADDFSAAAADDLAAAAAAPGAAADDLAAVADVCRAAADDPGAAADDCMAAAALFVLLSPTFALLQMCLCCCQRHG